MPPFLFTTNPTSYPTRRLHNMAPPNHDPECKYTPCYQPPPSSTPANLPPPAVTITLRATRPMSKQTRNILLHPDEPVNVGRSSRSEVKNLSATTENGLFDCPVISRRHAELELKLNKWTEDGFQVSITDTGSMHGTLVNGQKLVPERPFQLREGDSIRLGESVNRAESESSYMRMSSPLTNTFKDNYDGVTVTVETIRAAIKTPAAQVKSSQHGISVPSDSESDFDDEDDSDGGADLHPSSAHTTPDQGNAKSGSQPAISFPFPKGSNFITIEDDNEEPVSLFSRRAPGHATVIPDTFATDSAMLADPFATTHAADVPHSSLQFSGEYSAIDEDTDVKAAMAAADAAPSADEGFDRDEINSEDDDSASPDTWSDNDHFSDEGQDSDEHSESHEDFDRQSFLSEEFNMTDDIAVEDDEDDEGPEIMSSKRRPSNELGTLGDEPIHTTPEASREAAIPARPRYDPVRGGFQISPSAALSHRSYETFLGAPTHDLFADLGHSNKWDVGPAPTFEESDLHNHSFVNQMYPSFPSMTGAAPRNYDPIDFQHDYRVQGMAPAYSYLPFGMDADATHSPFAAPALSEPISIIPESNMKKRKATEISTSSEPAITTQTPASDEVNKEAVSVADPVTTAVAPAEPQPKKRKIKQAHSQKSILRTAVIEAGKYTAGAIIGGIGLVTILASPIGEALASC